MKRIIIAFITVILAICICSCNQDPKNDSVKGHIVGVSGYENLKSIGVGVVSENSRAVDSTDAIKLIGMGEDGAYKVVTFLDENGESVTQDYQLLNFRDFYSYILFQFAPPEYCDWVWETDFEKGCGNFDENYDLYYHDYCSMRYQWSAINNFLAEHKGMRNEFMVYVLDKDTGKIYELADENGDMIYPSFYWNPDPADMGAGLYYSTNNYAGFVAYYVDLDSDQRTVTKTNYRMSIVDQKLKLEKLQDDSVFKDWISGGMHDRYGNCYSGHKDLSTGCKYLINNDGQLKAVGSETGFMGMNNIYYSGTQWVNADGNLEAASFIPDSKYYCLEPSKYLIKEDDNVCYYLDNDHVMKITYLDEERIAYSLEQIELEEYDNTAKHSVSNGRIVYLTGSSIAYYSPEDGAKHILSNQYFYNSMTVLFDGTIKFSAVDSNFNVVEGLILLDGTVSTDVSQADVVVLSLTALN